MGAAHSPGLNYTAKAMDIGVYPAFFLVCCASDITTRCPFHRTTLPVLVASRHSRESGHPGDEGPGYCSWLLGMTFYWRRTYETDI